MREIGYSDKIFLYKDTRDLRIRIIFTQQLNLEILKKTAEKALERFPEFKVRPVKSGGKFHYEDNNNAIVFAPEDKAERYLGTAETNHYLFYFVYSEKSFVLSMFHGLSDFVGMWTFLKDIIYYYSLEMGLALPSILSEDLSINETERFNPYEKFADATAVPEYAYNDPTEVFQIPEKRLDASLHQQHEFQLLLSTQKFLELARSWQSSFVPALVALTSNVIADLYNVKDKSIVCKVPANMRAVFNTPTRANFSDAMIMAINPELLTKPIEEQCKDLRDKMNLQLKKENFQLLIASAVENVQNLEGTITQPKIKLNMPALTYALTYPGRMDLPEEYKVLVEDFRLEAYVPVDSIRLTVKTTGDDMLISLVQNFDTDIIAYALRKRFEELGLSVNITDCGRFGGDWYSKDRIESV